jgi:hypothetical protein
LCGDVPEPDYAPDINERDGFRRVRTKQAYWLLRMNRQKL